MYAKDNKVKLWILLKQKRIAKNIPKPKSLQNQNLQMEMNNNKTCPNDLEC